MDATLRAAAASTALDQDPEQTFRGAVVDALTQLVVATGQLREQNADILLRVSALENPQAATSNPRRFTFATLVAQLQTNWRLLTFAGMAAVELAQILGPHLSWH